VIFDILAPDGETSMLPDGLKFLFYTNPSSMSLSYAKGISPVHTYGGFVEFHWGNALQSVSFENIFGGFTRVGTGLSAVTNDTGQGRRQTLAYDKAMDYLALFHNNGSIYDSRGTLAIQGYVQLAFEPGIYQGWFNEGMQIVETADKPYSIQMSSTFVVSKEIVRFRSSNLGALASATTSSDPQELAQEGINFG